MILPFIDSGSKSNHTYIIRSQTCGRKSLVDKRHLQFFHRNATLSVANWDPTKISRQCIFCIPTGIRWPTLTIDKFVVDMLNNRRLWPVLNTVILYKLFNSKETCCIQLEDTKKEQLSIEECVHRSIFTLYVFIFQIDFSPTPFPSSLFKRREF